MRARLSIRPNPDAVGRRQQLRLDGEHFELASASRSTANPLVKQDYRQTDEFAHPAQDPGRALHARDRHLLDPEANKALPGLYRTKGIYCTQCEAEGFRRITYFLDRPDVLATYTVRIEADPHEAPVLLSNGNLVERGVLDGGKRHYAMWHDPFPKPCYLFALVGGDLGSIASTFRTMSGREVDARHLRRARQGGARRVGDGFA